MTATTSAKAAGFMSVAGFSRMLATMGYAFWALFKVLGVLGGIAAIAAADVYVGGVVLVDMLSGSIDDHAQKVGWIASIATSAILTALWGAVFSKKKLGWLLVVPALGLSVFDTLVDARYPTLQLYGHDVVMNSGLFPPRFQFAWILLEGIFTIITLFGEPIITLLFAYLFSEIRKMVGGIAEAGIEPEVAPAGA